FWRLSNRNSSYNGRKSEKAELCAILACARRHKTRSSLLRMIWGTLSLGSRQPRSKAQTGIKNSSHAYENDRFNSAHRKARRCRVDQFDCQGVRAFLDFDPVRKGNGACCWKRTGLSNSGAWSYDGSVGRRGRRRLNSTRYRSTRRDDQTNLRHQRRLTWFSDLRQFIELPRSRRMHSKRSD